MSDSAELLGAGWILEADEGLSILKRSWRASTEKQATQIAGEIDAQFALKDQSQFAHSKTVSQEGEVVSLTVKTEWSADQSMDAVAIGALARVIQDLFELVGQIDPSVSEEVAWELYQNVSSGARDAYN